MAVLPALMEDCVSFWSLSNVKTVFGSVKGKNWPEMPEPPPEVTPYLL